MLPAPALAVRLVDRNYDHDRLAASYVSVQEEEETGLYRNSSKGLQANFHDEEGLVKLMRNLYGQDISFEESLGNLDNENQDGIAYFVSMNNRKEDSSIRTIKNSLDLEREDAIRMPSKMALYHSIEDFKQKNPKGYQNILDNYGAENTFFQALDINENKFVGLYSNDGELLVDKNNKKVE